jgi:hypothetical protein
MAKSSRPRVSLDPLDDSAPAPPVDADPVEPFATIPATVTVPIYVRAPYALAQELRDLAHRRSMREGRRVTTNELAVEALRELIDKLRRT